jgi:hypothetical protein
MSSKHTFRVFFSLIIFGIAPIFTYAQSSVCHIQNPDKFLKKINTEGTKTIDFEVAGLSEKSDVDKFILSASAADNVLDVKVSSGDNKNRTVTVRFNEMGSMNSFRLMLMRASVQTLTTPSKTFDVLHLPVKKPNPFE